MITVLIGIFLLIIWLELPMLIKNRLYKEIGVFFVFFILGVVMALVNFYNVPLSNPFEALTYLLESR